VQEADLPQLAPGRYRLADKHPGRRPRPHPKMAVWEAYERVKANKGAAGVDDQSIAEFDRDW
jgi:hypothetical protein